MRPIFLAAVAAFAPLVTLAAPAMADTYLARCHMGECLFYDQQNRQVLDASPGRPGTLVSITLRPGISDRPDGTILWQDPAPMRVFCSATRPAFEELPGQYYALNLMQTAGATQAVTALYLKACHPGTTLGDDLPAAAQALGYGLTPEGRYASYEALIAH